MSFLSIAFLAALPLAAAPILLHLFDRRRNVVIEWGAMEFLLEAATRKTSARRLKQWLLLLLRVLAVTALVLALARPMLPGHWFGSTEHAELVLVIDNSMSTQRGSEDENIFRELIAQARSEVKNLSAGDSVRILLASPYPIWVTPGALRIDAAATESAASQLDEIRPTQGSSDLLAAMFTAVQADYEPSIRKRHVMLFTDGQAADWNTDDERGWRRFQETLKSASLPTVMSVVEVETSMQNTDNLAVNSVRASRTVVGVDQPFSVTARVQNYSSATRGESQIVWHVDGDEIDRDQLPEIAGGETYEPVLHHQFSRPGVYSINCHVDAEDALATDNDGTVVVEVVNEVPVLVVESAGGRAELQQDAYFLQAAMGYLEGEAQASRGVHQPEVIRPDDLELADLDAYRAIIVPNMKTLSREAIERLNQFAFRGGGVWMALGPRTDIEEFNQYLFADGNGLAPLALDRIVDETQDADRKTTINPALREHPATQELADTERLDTADVRIQRRMRFVPPPQDEDVSVLLSLTNGEPLAVEKYYGRGRIIVQGIPLRMDQWSELAKSQAFVVLVHDWLSYLTQPQATRHNLTPGDPIAVHLADSEHHEAVLRTPHGDEIDLNADTAGEGVVFRSSRTILPGDYMLQLGLSGDSIPFHVARNTQESDLSPLTQADQTLLSSTAGLTQDLLSSGMSAASHRDPVWPLLLVLLILFMTAELLLSGLISRERFGGEAIAESSENFADKSAALPVAFAHKNTVHDSLAGTTSQVAR